MSETRQLICFLLLVWTAIMSTTAMFGPCRPAGYAHEAVSPEPRE